MDYWLNHRFANVMSPLRSVFATWRIPLLSSSET
jgi:hypothetical protein